MQDIAKNELSRRSSSEKKGQSVHALHGLFVQNAKYRETRELWKDMSFVLCCSHFSSSSSFRLYFAAVFCVFLSCYCVSWHLRTWQTSRHSRGKLRRMFNPGRLLGSSCHVIHQRIPVVFVDSNPSSETAVCVVSISGPFWSANLYPSLSKWEKQHQTVFLSLKRWDCWSPNIIQSSLKSILSVFLRLELNSQAFCSNICFTEA